MREGRLPENIKNRSVLKQFKKSFIAGKSDFAVLEDEAVIIRSDGGERFAVSVSNYVIESEKSVWYAINSAVNKLAGIAQKITVSFSILLPENLEESDLKKMMCTVDESCTHLHINTADADISTTRAVNTPVFSVTAYGVIDPERVFDKSKIKAGQDIVATKFIGLEGTALLAETQEERLLTRYTESFVRQQARSFGKWVSVLDEADIAVRYGAVAMHAMGQGGVLAALWDISRICGKGLEADMKEIPIKQETVEICEFFGYNPYQLISGGSLIIISDDGHGLVRELNKHGIAAKVIGKLTDNNDKVLMRGDERRFIDRPQMDEIWKGRY